MIIFNRKLSKWISISYHKVTQDLSEQKAWLGKNIFLRENEPTRQMGDARYNHCTISTRLAE